MVCVCRYDRFTAAFDYASTVIDEIYKVCCVFVVCVCCCCCCVVVVCCLWVSLNNDVPHA